MLVNVQGPEVNHIRTHDAGTEFEFHTVQLTETRSASGGNVDLFIRADWSDWDAMVAKVIEYRQTTAARALGTEHGHAAGSWAIDGDTSAEYARKIIDGYEAGDPEVMDMQPSPLSGEWADGALPGDVYAAAGVAVDSYNEPMRSEDAELLDEYEAAFSEAYWDEVIRHARIIAEPEFVQTTCRGCGLDIEGTVGSSEWRDRGNNTMCPESGDDAHEPIDD